MTSTFRPLLVLALFTLAAILCEPRLALSEARPDFLLLFGVFVALHAGGGLALGLGWTAGLAKDLFSQGPLGLHAILFLGVTFCILRVRALFFVDRLLSRFLLALGAALVSQGACVAVVLLWHPHVGAQGAAIRMSGVLYTAALAPLLFPFLGKARKWMKIEPAPGFGPG